MVQAITATYVQEDDDWAVKVAGLGKELSGRAPGIIAARDRADQLVEKLVPEGTTPTVVHLLNGSALEFTTAYMTARLARTDADEVKAAVVPEQARPEDAGDQPEAEASQDTETQAETKAEEPEAESQDETKATAQDKQDKKGKQQTPEGKRTTVKRAVPRKELSKSPEATTRSTGRRSATDAETQDKAESAYPGKVAAVYGGHTAGPASATG